MHKACSSIIFTLLSVDVFLFISCLPSLWLLTVEPFHVFWYLHLLLPQWSQGFPDKVVVFVNEARNISVFTLVMLQLRFDHFICREFCSLQFAHTVCSLNSIFLMYLLYTYGCFSIREIKLVLHRYRNHKLWIFT